MLRRPSPGPAEPESASRSLLRTRITNQAVARARTAIAAAGMNAVEMPWANTSCPQGAGSWCVLANSAFCSAVPSAMNCGSCFSASSFVAVPKTVVRMDRPSDPPTCCVVLSSPEAAPASCGATPETAVSVSVTKFSPMPKPNTSIGPRTPLTYELSELMSACQASPVIASAEPTSMKGLGPRTGRNRWDRPAPSAITTVTGRKASPAWIGLYPSTFCTNSTM
ncbi:hypothetical protein GCM10017668_52900 [Streptomyces tuirus]|uniref:Uncharacterized protein n=1 Tax=Streptomyces tuirus TaxID=68278 RepID=A0A7G1NP35_9ACTN|nr:hypothetical protein GCM10017668_52900 [Streptomyces tuirus]